ncbi:helix-turn-helix domain-containing protein [Actinomadura luteofluorescens]|uniref:PucR family transcriptional regulator n=1 Tax=Actinomadura luteofluorescens TaxID=46163 RepID=UPI0030CD0BF4
MRLSDLLAALRPDQLRAESVARDGIAVVDDVVVHDPPQAVERGQVVLAVGVEASSAGARELAAEAGAVGAAAVVFRDSADEGPVETAREFGTSVLRAQPGLGWARLVTLLRTLISATTADPEARSERLAPSSVHGLADAIAVMVGGSVVLYDRAHRVIAYSVQDFEVDSVRRDTILGRQTPEQWIERFTADRSAYETFRNPGSVVRLDGYPGLRTRLRIAIWFEGEALGEISVAEGRQRLGAEAEAALSRAAELAVPFMLRHRLVEDTDRAARTRMARGLMYGDLGPGANAVAELGLGDRTGFVVVGFAGEEPSGGSSGLLGERILHLLSLQMSSIDPATVVVLCEGVYYALVPTPDENGRARLAARVKPALSQLERMGAVMRAAIGTWGPGLAGLPASRQMVDDLLQVARRSDVPHAVVTAEDLWPDLALLPVENAVGGAGFEPCAPLRRLIEHDAQQHTDYLTTLRVYLDEFGSVSKASERLVLHSNTLRHRLQRLGEISGLDLADPVQRLAVAVQLRVLRVRERGHVAEAHPE